jgi:hypothetical protein
LENAVSLYAEAPRLGSSTFEIKFLQEALTFATFEPGMYEIVRTFKPVAKLPESSSP